MQTASAMDNRNERLRTRREFLGSSALALLGMYLGLPEPSHGLPATMSLNDRLARVEKQSGGRMGVALLDSGSGQILGQRMDEPFPMCSTFKVLAVAAILARVDQGREQLQRAVPVGQTDILKYAPVTSRHAGSVMTVAELCEAAITLSD
ncbi:MAG TPA: serine hydrolase, partial [Candidatus Methylacidiphilales bacterium]|nr:serine hydrolase [Candidatus Methylacidiphilales bacterium]